MSIERTTKRFAILSQQVYQNVKKRGCPQELLEMVEECISLAHKLGLEPEVFESMYVTRAHALQLLAAGKKLAILEDEVRQHNYQVLGQAMREYMFEKEGEA
ncbi:MAG: hypothetical protein DRP83_00680 [Planctomycetota bacterium]|nr:MAG: hypothetical protein DRP83_00680 [Planctomycetota bacterium]